MTAAIAIDLDQIIPRILKGEYCNSIAADIGVSPQTLSNHLKKREDWKDVLETAHELRLDQCDQDMLAAIEERDFDLARAREAIWKRREYRAKVDCPARFGDNGPAPQVAVQVNIVHSSE